MIKIGIFSNKEKDKDYKYTRILIDSICRNGGKAIIPYDTGKELGPVCEVMEYANIYESAEIAICVGGDGTFLSVAREAYRNEIPVLGVNLGSLGFLTEVDKNDIDSAIGRIMEGNYAIENRMMLEAVITRKNGVPVTDVALNDIVVSHGAMSKILHLKTFIDNGFLDSYPGDGLIISTPTGSTAYSLAAGGPIVEPENDLIIITPICPHLLYSRSYITQGNRIVNVIIDENYRYEAVVTVDGQTGYAMEGGDSIEIKKSSHFVKLVRIKERNFFNVLRTKIYERGESLRKDEIWKTGKDT